jgi:hypothetical protein
MIELSKAAADAILDVLGGMMDGGTIELQSDQRVLAVLKLADPAALPAVDGELEFNEITEGKSRATGAAIVARILGSDGNEILSCDVGDETSEAVVKLNTTFIARGGPVQLVSFVLVMPYK